MSPGHLENKILTVYPPSETAGGVLYLPSGGDLPTISTTSITYLELCEEMKRKKIASEKQLLKYFFTTAVTDKDKARYEDKRLRGNASVLSKPFTNEDNAEEASLPISIGDFPRRGEIAKCRCCRDVIKFRSETALTYLNKSCKNTEK